MSSIETAPLHRRTGGSSVPPSVDSTIEKLLNYIEHERQVTFDDIHRYMDQENLRFGANTNTIDILDLAAYRTGRIDVNYHNRTITSRDITSPTQPVQQTMLADRVRR